MWKRVSERRYFEMLECLPPAVWLSYGFLVGEPHDHRECKITGRIAPSFAAFAKIGDAFYEGPTMTAEEFRRLELKTVTESSHA